MVVVDPARTRMRGAVGVMSRSSRLVMKFPATRRSSGQPALVDTGAGSPDA